MQHLASRRTLLIGAALSAFSQPVLAAVKAPKIEPLTGTAPSPYDETADAAKDVAAAAARAKRSGKILLLDFGGNWCPDCRVLAAVLHLPTAKSFVSRHYETVYVDVGRKDKNLELAAKYGLATIKGVPAVVAVAPDGRILNKGDEFALTTARSWSPQAVVDKLASWVPA